MTVDVALEEWDWQDPEFRSSDGSVDRSKTYFTLRVLSVEDEAAVEDSLVEFVVGEDGTEARKRYRTGSQTLMILDRGLVRSHGLKYRGKDVEMVGGRRETYAYLSGLERIRIANAIVMRYGIDDLEGE